MFKHPTAYYVVGGLQREIPLNFILDVTYVGRRGAYLQRERDINQMRSRHDPGKSGCELLPRFDSSRVTAKSGLSENAGYSKYNSLQMSAERRYKNGFKFSVAYTLGHSEDNASSKRDVLFNAYDDTGFWGNSSFDRRHVFAFSYIYDLPFYREQAGVTGKILGGWQITGSTFMRTGTPLWVTEGADTRRHRRHVGHSLESQRRSEGQRQREVLGWQRPRRQLLVRQDRVLAPAAGTFGTNNPRDNVYNPGQYQWDIALFKNVTAGGSPQLPVQGGDLQLPEPCELERR